MSGSYERPIRLPLKAPMSILSVGMLKRLVERRPTAELIPSDNGPQFVSQTLRECPIASSRSPKVQGPTRARIDSLETRLRLGRGQGVRESLTLIGPRRTVRPALACVSSRRHRSREHDPVDLESGNRPGRGSGRSPANRSRCRPHGIRLRGCDAASRSGQAHGMSQPAESSCASMSQGARPVPWRASRR